MEQQDGKGPVGRAYREEGAVVINDFLSDPETVLWREAARKHGLAGCAAFPINFGGKVAGTIAVYSGEVGVFGRREIALLSEVAGDISFALDTMRRDEERRFSEKALRDSETRFRTLIEHAPDAVFVHTNEEFAFLNNAAVRLFGAKSADQLVGHSVMERIHPDFVATVRERISRIFGQQEAIPLHEHVYLRLDGSPVVVEVTATPITFHGVVSAAVFARDVTERREFEARLLQQGALLDTANDAMMVCDLEHKLLYWNKGAERLYGWDAREVVGRYIPEFLVGERSNVDAAHRETLENGGWTGEIRLFNKKREEVTVLSRWTLIRDEANRPKSIFTVDTDITEKKKLETQFLRAQRLESVGQLAGGIAHDLNNILTPILMAAPLLHADETRRENAEMLGMIESCAQRGSEIVRQILLFSRGSVGEKKPLPVRPLLNEMANLVRETFPKGIELRTGIPSDLWMVLGDSTQLHQLLLNLVVNARDAMHGGGTLSITAENILMDEATASKTPGARPGPYVAWVVSDSGTGIPPEYMDRIFDPFFTTKELGKGTGLGLSTVIGIIRSHLGFIKVESKPKQGTHFRVYLPALEAGPSEKDSQEETFDSWPGRGETVLLVDDEETIRLMSKKVLEKAGYRVLLAYDGADALVTFTRQSADIQIVITDMMMPTMDGFSLIGILQRLSPDVKVITCTGMDGDSNPRWNGLKGIGATIKKPTSRKRLLQAVRTVLDGGTLPSVE